MPRRPPVPTDVPAFMAALDHPHKAGVEHLRTVIAGLDARIVEEIKWNAPSYRLEGGDHFATFRLQPPRHLQLVLHRGAKPRPLAVERPLKPELERDDLHGLLSWPADDRCVITLASSEEAVERGPDVERLIEMP